MKRRAYLNPSEIQRCDRMAAYADIPENTLPVYVRMPRDDFDLGMIQWRLSGWKMRRLPSGGVLWERRWSSCHGRGTAARVTLDGAPLALSYGVYAPGVQEPWCSHLTHDNPLTGPEYAGRRTPRGVLDIKPRELARVFLWLEAQLRARHLPPIPALPPVERGGR